MQLSFVQLKLTEPLLELETSISFSTDHPTSLHARITAKVPSEFLPRKPAINKCKRFRRLVIGYLKSYQYKSGRGTKKP